MVKGDAVTSFNDDVSPDVEYYGEGAGGLRPVSEGSGIFLSAGAVHGGFVIPYGDSPLDQETVGELVYLDIINTARNYVHIMTPYLII